MIFNKEVRRIAGRGLPALTVRTNYIDQGVKWVQWFWSVREPLARVHEGTRTTATRGRVPFK